MKKLLLLIGIVIAFSLPQKAWGIAFATTTQANSGSATTLTKSFDTLGGNFMGALVLCGNSRTISAMTWNGVSMTGNQIGNSTNPNDTTQKVYFYAIAATTTGAKTFSVTLSGAAFMYFELVSYYGINSAVPEATSVKTAGSVNTFFNGTTTVTDNSWIINASYTGGAPSATTTATVIRTYTELVATNFLFIDSGAPVSPAGFRNLGYTTGGNALAVSILGAFAPTTTTPVTTPLDSSYIINFD
jgi:hypothetical protein